MIHMFQNRAIRISKGNELLFQLFADWGNITTWSTLRERLYLIPKGCFQLLSLLYQVGQFFVSLGSARERIDSSFCKTPKAKSEHRCENSLKSCAWIFYDLCWGEFLWVNKIMFMGGNRPFSDFPFNHVIYMHKISYIRVFTYQYAERCLGVEKNEEIVLVFLKKREQMWLAYICKAK